MTIINITGFVITALFIKFYPGLVGVFVPNKRRIAVVVFFTTSIFFTVGIFVYKLVAMDFKALTFSVSFTFGLVSFFLLFVFLVDWLGDKKINYSRLF